MRFGIAYVFLFLFLVGSFVSAGNISSCANLGEQYSTVFVDQYPPACCVGLKAWEEGMDTRIIVNGACVSTGALSGWPVGRCLACGDQVCNGLENVCNCPEDCNKTVTCASEGNLFSKVFVYDYPSSCCSGLTEWQSGMDTREVVDGKCVDTGRESGNPVGTCIKCGDNFCGLNENVCNCPEDCPENGKCEQREGKCCIGDVCESISGECNPWESAVVTCNADCLPVISCTNTSRCHFLYWIDNENKLCDQQAFCGFYMYYGLQTFETKEECENGIASLNVEHICTAEEKLAEICTMEYVPVCGAKYNCGNETFCKENNIPCGVCSDESQTYGNSCAACADGVESWIQGECGKKINKNETEKQIFTLSNGRRAEIKIMPETASEKAIEVLGNLNFTIELKEVGNNQTAYELTSVKEGKMFGLFNVKGNVSIQIDAETGKVLKTIKPWWAFLASGI